MPGAFSSKKARNTTTCKLMRYFEYWEQRPTPLQILRSQVQSLRYSQPGHTEMLRSIPITGVSRKGKDQFTRQEIFLHALKDEYFLEDVDHVTKKLFLEWIERPNKNLQATELLRKFERQYSQLSKVEKLTLEPNKVDLFLQAVDGELQGKLELLLEDKEEDEGLTTKWKNVEDAVGLLTKREMRKNRSNIPKTVQAPKAPKDGKIALKDREDLLQTNFGKGGMRALVQDYLKEHETVVRESASYGARVDDEIGGSTKTSEFWASAVSTMQEGKLPREALLRTAATIRRRTGWEDLVESLSVHAYIAKSQHEALMEEKRRGNFDDTREGNSSKRQTRGDKTREATSQELPLLSHIEAATNLKEVLEERILNAKVEFTLKEVLGIIKKEFYDVIIDSIKRKRQLMGETGMSHAIDARIYKDEEEVDIGYKQPTNEKNEYNQRARATTEVLVKVGDIEEPIVALVDHGLEINLMSKDLYKKQKWPIDMEHGWARQAANKTRGELYGTYPDVKIRIGDVATEQHFFVQDTTSYLLILGQPYITAMRKETKVLDDGSAYAREVLSRDEGAFDASFIRVSEIGNIRYKKVDDFKRKERKRLYNIERELRKLGTLQDDERILGVYEQNGLEDSLELITSIGLGDNNKIVEIHSREVYTILESFQVPEDSKEQMGEASKEPSLRDPMSIGHQFTKETFEELKIGFDGSLLPEEITYFKKMLAK
uniref:Predicted protein n=1 Tax=Physcomitrium patens TaxID=3218 RepID=A9U5K9_PHYPA